MSFNATEHPHRRLNPLTGEWMLVSPHRMNRPWQGQIEKETPETRPTYDPNCYLCPGNDRSGGVRNPQYESTFVFANDFAALLQDTPLATEQEHPLLQAQSVQGTCRVICFSPYHDLTLPEMPVEDIRNVVDTWAGQVAEFSQRYRWVKVFENKGVVMGCSNPHPHGQIWAQNLLPNEPAKEDRQQRAYYIEHGRTLLVDYARLEVERGTRIVVANEHWLAVVPFWAVWPFETLLLPRRHILHLPGLTAAEREALADILKRLLTKYDNLFETSFPYSMGWHGAPNDTYQVSPAKTQTSDQPKKPGRSYEYWQLHAHFYPPLLRSATVKKFMVGYEMLSEAQRDLTAEHAAAQLRVLSEIHYKHKV